MTNLHRFCYGALLVGCLLPVMRMAQSADRATRQYDIELLVFQNLVDNDNGEIWPAADSPTWDERGAGHAGAGQQVHWLPESRYRMKAERNALNRSSRYRTLAYLAWRQPVVDRDNARALELPAPSRPGGAWVGGTVRVAVERFLHLYLDLQLHLPAGAGPGGAQIRLTEQRRMRSKELHYFDNPRFGVIALITPYEPPAAEASPAATPTKTPTAEK